MIFSSLLSNRTLTSGILPPPFWHRTWIWGNVAVNDNWFCFFHIGNVFKVIILRLQQIYEFPTSQTFNIYRKKRNENQIKGSLWQLYYHQVSWGKDDRMLYGSIASVDNMIAQDPLFVWLPRYREEGDRSTIIIFFGSGNLE